MFRETGFRVVVVVFIMLTAGTVFSQGQGRAPSRNAPKPAPAPFMIEAESHEESQRVTKTVFKNGLTVLVYESGAQPLVSIRTYVSGGFLDDPVEMSGLSELTARAREIVGEGAPTGSIREKARSLGGVFHGVAGQRYSRFEITVPSARWKQALAVQAEAMLTPFENNEALPRHVSRIADHMQYDEQPDIAAVKELRALAFGDNRFAEPGHLLKIAPEKIIEFHKNRYIPPAMTMVVAGDVRAGEVLNEIVRAFISKNESPDKGTARIDAELIPATGKGVESAGEFRYRAISGDTDFPKVFLGFPVSSENSEDYRALEVLAAILGTGETSVLNTRLRDRKNLVFTARAEIESLDGEGFFFIELETEPQNIDRTEIAFWTEAEILKRNGPSEAELARAAAQLERIWWERRETVGELADTLARFELQGGWKRMDGYIAEIRKVTAGDVKRVIERYITLSNCALLEYLPRFSPERNLTAATLRATLESLLRPAVSEELNARAGEIETGYKIPPAGAAFRLNEVRYSFQAASILRGPEIYIREDHTSPLVEMGVFFTGGKAFESEANAGITALVLELMMDNERENRQLEIYGGRLTPVVTDDYFGFFLSIPSRNFSGGFERIKQAIKSPVFDRAEIEKLKQSADARARLLTAQTVQTAQEGAPRRINEALFRGHSYAAESFATPASLKNISVETLRDWYEENVRNVKPFVAIVGDTEGSSLASWFVSEFSGSRMRDEKKAVSSSKPAGKAETINYSDAGTSAILLGFHAPSAGDMDSYGMFILKDYMENRLREREAEISGEKIQEREVGVRRITCEYRSLLSGGSFVISAAVNAGDEKRGAEILREEVARLIAQPLSYADFHAARALAAGSYTTGNQTRRMQIENLTKSLLAGRNLEEYRNFSRNIEQFEEEDFKELMHRVLDMNKSVTITFAGGDS